MRSEGHWEKGRGVREALPEQEGQRTGSGRTPHLQRRQLKVLLCSSRTSACIVPRTGNSLPAVPTASRHLFTPHPTPGCSRDSQVSSVGKLRSKKDKGVVPELSSPLSVKAKTGTLHSSDSLHLHHRPLSPASQPPAAAAATLNIRIQGILIPWTP